MSIKIDMLDDKTKKETIATRVELQFKYRPSELIYIGNPEEVLVSLGKDYEYVGLCTYRLKKGVSILRKDNIS